MRKSEQHSFLRHKGEYEAGNAFSVDLGIDSQSMTSVITICIRYLYPTLGQTDYLLSVIRKQSTIRACLL